MKDLTVLFFGVAFKVNNTINSDPNHPPEDSGQHKYYTADIICMAMYLCMMIPIVFGNGLVLRTIALFSHLHSCTHILIGSLATAGKFHEQDRS